MENDSIGKRAQSRREFVRTAAGGAPLLGAPAVAATRLSANDRVRVAIIGLRGRGRSHFAAVEALASQNVQLAAVCDIDESVLAQRLAEHTQRTGHEPATFTDVRRLLDDPSYEQMHI